MRAKEIYKYTTGERVHRREMNREQPRRRGTRRGGASGIRAKSSWHQGWPYISRGPGGAPPSVPGAQRHRVRRAHIVQVLWCEPQPYPIASTPPADPKCVGAALERTGEARKSNVALTELLSSIKGGPPSPAMQQSLFYSQTAHSTLHSCPTTFPSSKTRIPC